MNSLTRREFVQKTALVAAVTKLASTLRATETAAVPVSSKPLPEGMAELRWLDGKVPGALPGTTWGVAWPRGKYARDTTFVLRVPDGDTVPVQSWPLACWPDGTLKWTGHALPADAPAAESFELLPGTLVASAKPLAVTETAGAIEIDTGIIKVSVAKSGRELIPLVTRDGREILRHGRLVMLRQDQPAPAAAPEPFEGEISKVTLEQNGPVRAVVRIEGRHASATGRTWLPFIVRLYLYAGGESIRALHTIIFDGDEQKDFISGLGLRLGVPLSDAHYDRHVRFAGEEAGLFAEAVQGLTGLRRDPGRAVRDAQLAGHRCPPQSEWSAAVVKGLKYIPVWGDYTLAQLSADGFEIRKRTKPGYTWIKSASGRRAGGTGYLGGPSGGVAFGLRNFWQSYPAQFDIRGASGDEAEVTLWFWSPEAAPMDLRGYHDGMGEDTYAKQTEGLDITYEDFEPGFDKPEGVARTSELFLWALPVTPSRERLVELAAAVRTPPVLVCRPEYYHAAGVFGGIWNLPDRSSPPKARIEDQLDFNFAYYLKQQAQHRWFGFWNYGDVMHTYDADRHAWRYDVGGFAWDNSELSTDIWLWLYFLRTGRADVFRFAEAMTRHTGEVDVHHVGRFAPLGSRHNVLHWGCSAKQLRISTAANRRYYYYLTADERIGDLMREQIEAVRTLAKIPPGRKLAASRNPDGAPTAEPGHARVGFGTDWGAVSAAWLTEWERTGDVRTRDRLVASMRSIARQPRGFFSSSAVMNFDTGEFAPNPNQRASVSHLSAVFGLVEVCAELVQLLDEPQFKRAWLDYCELYNATPEEQERRLGSKLSGINLRQEHSRLTAFAAKMESDAALARRAWVEFNGTEGRGRHGVVQPVHLTGPAVLNPVDEVPSISTNSTAEWGLAAIQCLALVGDALLEI